VTQKTIAYEDEIHQHHFELIHYLDNLGDKVAGVIEHNEAEIFTAYKKHFARVKKELEEFKKHSEAQANSSNTYLEKIDRLEKQLVVFREESLKLFSRVTEKDKTIEHLKLTLEELLSEKRHMDGLIKQLSRRNRELETQKDKYERKHSETDNITL
jgi:DNA repair exonuclease SbcCD ATPase subunit